MGGTLHIPWTLVATRWSWHARCCLCMAPLQTSIICIEQWIRGWTKALRRQVVWAAEAATGKQTPTGMWHGAAGIQSLQQPHRRCLYSLHMLP